ncbi:MAG: SDR family oxidoreductase [Gammaproteobacteria bacterium]|nr:SDR family oxidoreductase [Gammaproteobacteria bacterium]
MAGRPEAWPPLQGRKAFVTGGGRGIGRAIAIELARQGCDVAISFSTRSAEAEETARHVRDCGVHSSVQRLRLECLDDHEPAVQAVLRELGGLDIYVSNAGQDFRGAPVAETSYEELLHLMTVNALAPHALCRLLLPSLRAAAQSRGRADIVLLSSIAIALQGPDYAPYVMSKMALEGLARTLALEERAHGLHVNVVAPGLTDTDMSARFLGSQVPGDIRNRIIAGQAYGHVCRPEEVAGVVAFFVGPAASYVNGQRIYVDGGGPQL